jgi:glycerol-1-phosphate dehydrogenase [NAD(P)+]
MANDAISELLAGTWRDQETGMPVGVPVQSIVLAESLAGIETELVGRLALGRRFAVVSDPATHEVLGARVESAVASLGAIESIRLPDRPHPDDATAAKLRAATAAADALIAVGSGTINDLCKYVAAQDGKPYAVFGTAPSMNGYTSGNAAITVAGLKKSLPARAPAGVFLDLGVLAAAPARMIRSGLGDSLCRPTAQADWLLSHLLRGTAYREAPFALLAEDESALFDGAATLMAGDLTAMRRLARTLVLSGLGMGIAGGSYSASQGEHLISHYVEMVGAPGSKESFHGEQIGVTTLTLARLQERILARDEAPVLRPTAIDADDVLAHFGPETGAACLREFAAKALSPADADSLNERLALQWSTLRRRISDIHRSSTSLARTLAAAGAPTRPADLGWPAEFYRTALRRARQIRSRYTFLDLAGDAGLLESFAAGEG